MRINEITSDMRLLRDLRNAKREVAATPANLIALTIDCRLGSAPAMPLVDSAARRVVRDAFPGNTLKQAIKTEIQSRIAALETKYAGISVEEG